jgi:hypothetical protein
MTFEGSTLCPACTADIAKDLRDVLRKADERSTDGGGLAQIECPKCDANIDIHYQILYHVKIVEAKE